MTMRNKKFYHCDMLSMDTPAAFIVNKLIKSCNILAFTGEMGSGKTFLINKICKMYGNIADVSSPTFNIINTYISTNNVPIYHADLSRITNQHMLYNTGIFDIIMNNYLLLVEWPEILEGHLNSKYKISIEIKYIDTMYRDIIINYDNKLTS